MEKLAAASRAPLRQAPPRHPRLATGRQRRPPRRSPAKAVKAIAAFAAFRADDRRLRRITRRGFGPSTFPSASCQSQTQKAAHSAPENFAISEGLRFRPNLRDCRNAEIRSLTPSRLIPSEPPPNWFGRKMTFFQWLEQLRKRSVSAVPSPSVL